LAWLTFALAGLLAAALLLMALRERRAAAVLRANEERWRAFAGAASDWFWETDAQHRFTLLSEGRSSRRLPSEDLLGRTRWEIADPLQADWDGHRADLDARRPFRDFHYYRRDREGRLRCIRTSGAPHFAQDGAFLGYRGVSADVTEEIERREEVARIEAQARRGERLIRHAIESLSDGFAIFDADDRLALCNRTFADYHAEVDVDRPGLTFRELIRQVLDQEVIHPDQLKPSPEAWFEWRLERHANPQGPIEIRYRDGRWSRVTENRTVEGGVALVRTDITALKRHEEELARASQRLADAIEAIPGAFVLYDADDRLVLWNNKYAEFHGENVDILKAGRSAEEIIRMQAERGVYPDAVGRIDEFVADVVDWHRRAAEAREIQLADGRWLLLQQRRTGDGGRVGLRFDITESKLRDQQLSRAQKMEAVGQLTGGIAHDFNNLLTVILGNLDLLEELIAADARPTAHLKGALAAAERGAALTQRLLAFARRLPLRAEPIAVNELVGGMGELLGRTLGEDIELKLALAARPPRALADAAQLENALVNLALNARDAMPGGGRLTIETGEAELDEEYARSHAEVKAGRYVMIGVADTGHGMPPAVLERAVEPFFTTKGAGKGTGLGLSMVYGFAKQSGGHLRIYSEPGHGTSVRLYLPLAEAEPAAQERRPATTGGNETILVVEDDESVRQLVIVMLESLGYRVAAAADGREALAALEREPHVDLLFTDVVMPRGVSGRELADRAIKARPGLKVLFTSGYTENAIIHHGRLDEGVRLLSKPYQRGDLARKIREVLDG
jgi:PAS domain S-box-containing protein